MKHHSLFSFCVLIFILSGIAFGQEEMILKVRDDLTSFPAVETFILQTGGVYWGEKALGTLFGASIKKEGENLVILCKDVLCVPFYMDDPQNIAIERKGKILLLAPKVAKAFGYKRLEWDKASREIRLYKTPKPPLNGENPIPLLDLYLPDTTGQITFLSKYTGKKLIILVWAPWDKGRESLPAWNRLLSDLGDRCHYVLIAETMEGLQRIDSYLSLLKPRPACLVDAGFKATLFYQLKEIPAILLVDEKGNLASGPFSAKADDPMLREAISLWVKDNALSEILPKEYSLQGYYASLDIEEAVKRLELSQILLISGNKEEALEEFDRAISRFPEIEIFKGQRLALLEPMVAYPPTPTPTSEKIP
ncbi:hypothetical protein JW926_17855 [Candidatus Sumerlaeota bacterium]|nr:hypothetical protein [Candidatus Sumerlaeota bacterium]